MFLHLHREHPLLLAVCYGLLVVHLALVLERPDAVNAFLYLIRAACFLLSATIVIRYAGNARRVGVFRWWLFAFYLISMVPRYVVAAFHSYVGSRQHFPGDFLSSVGFTVALLSLTLPSSEGFLGERMVDAVVATAFCVLRFLVLFDRTQVFKQEWQLLTFYAASTALAWIAAQLAYSASSSGDRPFYRLMVWYFGLETVSTVLWDYVGVLYFHQTVGSAWSLAATAGQVIFVLLVADSQKRPFRLPRHASRNSLILSLLPFTMSLCVVMLGFLLMHDHPGMGSLSIAIGVAAFFSRTVFLARRLRNQTEALLRHNRKLTLLAHLDSLTGLANRRSFEYALAAALAPSSEAREPATLLLFDIDGFKGANDTYGHPHGDACLVAIAEVLSSLLPTRESEAFRLGGDEFAALWLGVDLHSALDLAPGLCRGVAKLKLRAAARTLTLSVGLAPVQAGMEVQTILHQADVALYRAKQRGGNCAEPFNPAAAEPTPPQGHRLRDVHAPEGN